MPLNTRRSRYDGAAGENSETVPNADSTARDGTNVEDPPDSISSSSMFAKRNEKKAGKSSRKAGESGPRSSALESISSIAEGLPTLVHAKALVQESARAREVLDSDSNHALESISCIGEIPANYAIALEENFAKACDVLHFDNLLEKYPDIEKLHQAKQIFLSVQKELEEVNKFRGHIKDPSATIVSFSSLTWPKLQARLGVKRPPPQQINWEQMTSILDTSAQIYHQSENKHIYHTDWDHTSVFDKLRLIDELVLQRKEASARININEWVLGLGKYLRDDRYWVLVIPEFTLQDTRDKEHTFATITYCNLNTALTGVSDYALIAQSEDIWTKEDFSDLKQAATTASSVMTLAGALQGANIVVVEAKDIMTQRLEVHIPQVVGQCIAILESDSARDAIPFYLTTGKMWIFGITARCPKPPNGSNRRHLFEPFIFPTFSVNTEDVSDSDTDVDSEIHLKKYDMFLKTLITWAKLKPSDIVSVITEELGRGKA